MDSHWLVNSGCGFGGGGQVIAFYKWPWVYEKGSLMCPVSGSIIKGVMQIPTPEAAPSRASPFSVSIFSQHPLFSS